MQQNNSELHLDLLYVPVDLINPSFDSHSILCTCLKTLIYLITLADNKGL